MHQRYLVPCWIYHTHHPRTRISFFSPSQQEAVGQQSRLKSSNEFPCVLLFWWHFGLMTWVPISCFGGYPCDEPLLGSAERMSFCFAT